MKRWFSVAILIILVVAFGFLKQGVHKSSLTDDQEQQIAQEAQKAQAEKAAKDAATSKAVGKPDTAPEADVLPAEEVIGNSATAKHRIQVGWIYAAGDAVNQNALQSALAEVRTFAQQSGGGTSAVLVDLDVPAEDRSPAARGVTDLGVDMDGQSVYPQNPSTAPPGTLTALLNKAIHR